MDDYMDYNSADALLEEEERRRREEAAAADVGEFQTLPTAEKPGFFDKMATAYGKSTGMGNVSSNNTFAENFKALAGLPQEPGMAPVNPQQSGPAPVGYGMGAGQEPAEMMPVVPQAPQAQPQAQPMGQAPSSYDAAALAAIRQKESSNNYNVGQHPGSSASGAYGITDRAYTDIQNRDPYFQGRDRAALSPEEQDRAALTLRGINDGYLRDKGVEVTEPNRQLAHFLGAGGAAQYLTSPFTNIVIGAGGGAGGLKLFTSTLSPSNYTATIGAGGTGTGTPTPLGSSSSLGAFSTTGGGNFQTNGGSGGGNGYWNNNGTIEPYPAGAGIAGEGNAGGNGFNGIVTPQSLSETGGGGGSGAAASGKNGGDGTNTYSSWASVTGTGVSGRYAGGGAGVRGTAGAGGGGASLSDSLTNNTNHATANSGSGGGGISTSGAPGVFGSNGGSGIIIVRYTKAQVD
jgi:hypothetical protein